MRVASPAMPAAYVSQPALRPMSSSTYHDFVDLASAPTLAISIAAKCAADVKPNVQSIP
jgi:hypothetical protein